MGTRKAGTLAGWMVITALAVFSTCFFSERVISAPFKSDAAQPSKPRIIQPCDGASVSGKIEIAAEAGTEEINNLVLLIDGRLRGITNVFPYRFNISTANWAPGKHVLQLKAFCADGRELTSSPITVLSAVPLATEELGKTESASPRLSQAPVEDNSPLSPEPKLAEIETPLQSGEQIVSLLPSDQILPTASAPRLATAKSEKSGIARQWLMTLTAAPGHRRASGSGRAQETTLAAPTLSGVASMISASGPAPALAPVPEMSFRLASPVVSITPPPAHTVRQAGAPELSPAAGPAAGLQLPTRVHVVMQGDSLWSISRHYQVTIGELLRLNNLRAKSLLQIGQTLNLPEPAMLSDNPTSAGGETRSVGSRLLPLRETVEASGGSISWNPLDKSITVIQQGKTFLLRPKEKTATIDGKTVNCREMAIHSGRTYLSAEFLEQTAQFSLPYRFQGKREATARLGR